MSRTALEKVKKEGVSRKIVWVTRLMARPSACGWQDFWPVHIGGNQVGRLTLAGLLSPTLYLHWATPGVPRIRARGRGNPGRRIESPEGAPERHRHGSILFSFDPKKETSREELKDGAWLNPSPAPGTVNRLVNAGKKKREHLAGRAAPEDTSHSSPRAQERAVRFEDEHPAFSQSASIRTLFECVILIRPRPTTCRRSRTGSIHPAPHALEQSVHRPPKYLVRGCAGGPSESRGSRIPHAREQLRPAPRA